MEAEESLRRMKEGEREGGQEEEDRSRGEEEGEEGGEQVSMHAQTSEHKGF